MRNSSNGREKPEPDSYKTTTSGMNSKAQDGVGKRNSAKKRSLLEEELRKTEMYSEASYEDTPIVIKSPKGVSENTSIKKQPVKKKPKQKKLKKLSNGRVFGIVLVAVLFSSLLGGFTYVMYINWVKYPKELVVDDSTTGIYCLRNYEHMVHSIGKGIGSDSYLVSELKYANGIKVREEFLKKVSSTISYNPKQVEAKNIYGGVMLDKKGNVVFTDSDVKDGEVVPIKYIDYSKVPLKKKDIDALMKEYKLKLGDADYPTKLIDVFCDYMVNLKGSDIPLTEDKKHIPKLKKKGNSFTMGKDEDIFLDQLLYSSKDFYKLLDDFSVVAGGSGAENPKWKEWNALPKEEKKVKNEPSKTIDAMQPSKVWVDWNALGDSEKEGKTEPPKYDVKAIVNKAWCGSYFLQNGYTEVDKEGNVIKKKVAAMLGSGTIKDPAGLNTDVMTYQFYLNKEGKIEKKPIKVRMVEFGVSEDAINWSEGKDERNRGIDIKSEVQYAYYLFEITNMSDVELVIEDNSSLADKNANLAPRTGSMYGLNSSVTLKPDESGTIETWSLSTELNKKYLIWGKDFDRKIEPVWFRVLAGDIDDNSEDKGVHLNRTRETNSGEDAKLESEYESEE